MGKFKFWTIGLISFFAVFGGTFCQRIIAVSLCGVLGANSPACYLVADGRVNAGVSPKMNVIAQNIDIFDNSNGGNISPGNIDIFSNPDTNHQNFHQPRKNPAFNSNNGNQKHRDLIQSQISNSSFSGTWFYILFDSLSTNTKPIYATYITIREEGKNHKIDICENNCEASQEFPDNKIRHIPSEKSITVIPDNLNIIFEFLPSKDGQRIWGEIRNRETSQSQFYFVMNKISDLVISSNSQNINIGNEKYDLNVKPEQQYFISLNKDLKQPVNINIAIDNVGNSGGNQFNNLKNIFQNNGNTTRVNTRSPNLQKVPQSQFDQFISDETANRNARKKTFLPLFPQLPP
ncbi:MAG: hypothetical protein QNJ51_22420 [Calothrix sp. MO_167.B12]|nr:hypothetical protein [Calothrix sp. MO_167.B12]